MAVGVNPDMQARFAQHRRKIIVKSAAACAEKGTGDGWPSRHAQRAIQGITLTTSRFQQYIAHVATMRRMHCAFSSRNHSRQHKERVVDNDDSREAEGRKTTYLVRYSWVRRFAIAGTL
ncbi:hypothetical protein DL89DRAFT_280328 [Linderina pennispora]|uniref:Uncharacterized protein n=1 Tax=Linderina pennispora TaxID=61395 RepID=A0A1Y1WJM5_9FUNG|nr:uncharacterized protein DL89DRAFT_280328 [Linderina pennispora]ORX73780.1 hypothetical protein DL89DRAFT_280328 [Linderina pennispora]